MIAVRLADYKQWTMWEGRLGYVFDKCIMTSISKQHPVMIMMFKHSVDIFAFAQTQSIVYTFISLFVIV